MKILFYSTAFSIHGGLERVWSDRMNALTRDYGYEVLLVTTDQGGLPMAYPLDRRVRHIDLGIDLWKRHHGGLVARAAKYIELKRLLGKRLTALLQQEQPDIITLWQIDEVAAVIRCAGKTPVVFESHNIRRNLLPRECGSTKERLQTRLRQRAVSSVSTIVALTPEDAADWREVNPSAVGIPNIVNLQEPDIFSTCEEKRVIFSGRTDKQKGLQWLIEIWQKVAPTHPDWALHIYGEGMAEADQQAFAPKSTTIYFHDATEEIMQKYCESSVLVLTSEFEPFGLVMPEAMSCGVPVVAFDCDYGPRNIITDGSDGMLAKCFDTTEFARKLTMLLDNPDLRKEMGRRAKASSNRYDSRRIMPRWTELYRKLSTP